MTMRKESEVRSLLSTEQLEEIGGRLAVVDVSPTSGRRVVRFWVDESPVHEDSASEARTPRRTGASRCQHTDASSRRRWVLQRKP